MGCVQSRPSFDSPPRDLEKLKLEKGYVGGHQPLVLKQLARISSHQKQRDEAAGAAADGGKREGKVLSREEEEKGNGDRASQKMITVVKKSGGDELKDGWPRWLTDNVPVEALAGLVRKSADSYDKLAKVCFRLILFVLALFFLIYYYYYFNMDWMDDYRKCIRYFSI